MAEGDVFVLGFVAVFCFFCFGFGKFFFCGFCSFFCLGGVHIFFLGCLFFDLVLRALISKSPDSEGSGPGFANFW